MKKLNNKGFTLVEIVIVIVIIAILAAMLVPSLTQWIDKSKKKTFLSACGTIRTAVAAELSEGYASDSGFNLANVDWAKVTADVGQNVSNEAVSTTNKYSVSWTNASTADAGFTVKDAKYAATWNGSSWVMSD